MIRFLTFLLIVCNASTHCAKAQGVYKGYVSQIMNAGRIVDGQELTTLDQLPYTKGQGAPFTILLLPKSDENVKEIEVIKARYYQGDSVVNVPLTIASWNSVALVYIDIDNPTLFINYYVYIGFGQDIPNN